MPDTTFMSSPEAARLALNEAQLVQNTALGSVLIWLCVRAYTDAADRGCPLPLCFLVLPVLFHHATREAAETTAKASPLSKFVEKFEANRQDLLALHPRMLALRPLTLRSLQLASHRGLLAIDFATADVRPARLSPLPTRLQPERLRKMIRGAERLGGWFAPHPISNIAAALRVQF
ncbi:MAG: hypothetical protein F9K29_18635 [Hyphomicrobiaceae bacterium]|nr:MAG: hypothetical protein F9K29_18635 [Hyphomicrobiaceae bacterium]